MADPATTGREPDDDPRTPFERFEGLAKKLVKVPKSELDEKLKKRETGPKRPSSRRS